jgi:hypothetical protein
LKAAKLLGQNLRVPSKKLRPYLKGVIEDQKVNTATVNILLAPPKLTFFVQAGTEMIETRRNHSNICRIADTIFFAGHPNHGSASPTYVEAML